MKLELIFFPGKMSELRFGFAEIHLIIVYVASFFSKAVCHQHINILKINKGVDIAASRPSIIQTSFALCDIMPRPSATKTKGGEAIGAPDKERPLLQTISLLKNH